MIRFLDKKNLTCMYIQSIYSKTFNLGSAKYCVYDSDK